MGKKIFKVLYAIEIDRRIWLLVGLVRSLKFFHKEVVKKVLLCEDYSDLTSPTGNQIPDIHNILNSEGSQVRRSSSLKIRF